MRLKTLALVMAVVAGAVTLGAQDRVREQKLQQAIDLLETKGDAARAMPLLEDVAKSTDKALAARALLYLGQAQEGQGKEGARRTYERIVRDFAGQTAAVVQARERMKALGASGSATGAVGHRLLWTLPPGGHIVSVSRDGRFVAYLDSENIVVRDLSNDSSRVIKPAKDQAFDGGTLSRDGGRIVLSVWNDATDRTEMHVADLTVDQPTRRIWEQGEAYPSDWTPDGRAVLTTVGVGTGRIVWQVALISAIDGQVTILNPDAGWRGKGAISPDGTQAAMEVRGSNGATDVAVFPLKGGAEVTVAAHASEDRLVGWDPDGSIIFSSRRSSGEGLWRQRMSGGMPLGDPEFLRPHAPEFQHLDVDAAGTILYSPFRASANIQVKVGVFGFDTGRWRVAPSEALDAMPGETQHADWSPDGKELSYIRDSGRRESASATPAVTFQPADSSLSTRSIAIPLAFVRWLRWTKDGTAVLVYGINADAGASQLLRVPRAATEVVTVAQADASAPDAFGGWSRDGSRVYLHRQFANGGIALVEQEWAVGRERELFRADDRAGYPVLSPDGEKLYYSKTVTPGPDRLRTSVAIERIIATGVERELSARRSLGGMHLSPDGRLIGTASVDPVSKKRDFLLIRTDGGGTQTVMSIPVTDAWLSGVGGNPAGLYVWAPDSSAMILRSDITAELWWVPVNGAGPQKVDTAGMRDVVSASRWSVHPDGGRIAFHSRNPTALKPQELWALQNALPKAR